MLESLSTMFGLRLLLNYMLVINILFGTTPELSALLLLLIIDES